MNIQITINAIALFISTWCWGQECVENISATANPQNYNVSNNGTVEDSQNNLMWARCGAGQHWQNDSCSGDILILDWEQAKIFANNSTLAGYFDWRLPSLLELSRITELRCQKPAIDTAIFPNTPSENFWSATEFVNNTSMAWLVHFSYGENHTDRKLYQAAIRLVRTTSKDD